ncbi:hypothetical protein AB1388_43735, partial [Streptomyces hydrogenans]|uniref:hypothetical protein n=1 Tax=Streptomyces hydrogenans TaxID=1873719 RepID=UPI00345D8E12
ELRRYTHFSEIPKTSDTQSPSSSWEKYANALRNNLLAEKKWPSRAQLFQLMARALIKDDGINKPAVWVEKTPHHINHLPKIAKDFPKA